ncbi:MAG: 5'/3'-nucleotidase SurE, partial [Desulfovibrio sp.]|nr:5'/3'-nucleotidase SurE [Desulfovibrio sp.]
VYQKRQDPRGQDYFWLIGDMKEEDILPLSDKALLREGYITLSSLRQSFDDPNGQSFLKKQVL